MKVFLTGATGFIGSHVLKKLIEKKHRVTGLYRNQKKIPPGLLNHKSVTWVNAEFTDFNSWKNHIKSHDVVINCVGIIRQKPGSTFQQVHSNIPRQLAGVAANRKVLRFIQLSALGAGSDDSIGYFRTKKEAEDAIVKVGEYTGMEYVILRPSLVYAYNSEAISLFRSLTKLPVTPAIAGGNYSFEPVFVEDLAEALSDVTNKKARNEIIEVGGPDRLTYKELLGKIAAADNKSLRFLPLPAWMVWPGAMLGNVFSFLPLTTEQLAMLVRGSVCSNNRLKEIFNIEACHFSDGLEKSRPQAAFR